jgi:hypothetical protein
MNLQTLEGVYGVSAKSWVVKKQFESGSRYMVGFGSVATDYSPGLGMGYVSGYSVQVLVNADDIVVRYSVEEIDGYDY